MTGLDSAARDFAAQRTVADWFDLHVDAIHAYVQRRVGYDLAGDIVSETFRIALEQFDRFDTERGGERAWLYGIASNVLRHHWRTEQRLLRTQMRGAAREPVPGDPLLAADARIDAARDVTGVLAAVERLAPEDRDLLFLVAWEERSSAEVAQALQIPAGTVRTRLQRIRAQLRSDQGATK